MSNTNRENHSSEDFDHVSYIYEVISDAKDKFKEHEGVEINTDDPIELEIQQMRDRGIDLVSKLEEKGMPEEFKDIPDLEEGLREFADWAVLYYRDGDEQKSTAVVEVLASLVNDLERSQSPSKLAIEVAEIMDEDPAVKTVRLQAYLSELQQQLDSYGEEFSSELIQHIEDQMLVSNEEGDRKTEKFWWEFLVTTHKMKPDDLKDLARKTYKEVRKSRGEDQGSGSEDSE
ncbi:hypothetical protein A2415_03090 [candidate division WWE3 bacterium RIFOXYC1_FULL_39_7]|uniref:Uncharacterized protein n=2 Tax=Katanobacteria TaxID=422282 RepID=A0A1F4X8I4_UNCKA|nr:MAG: hypothetical protein A2415_03090 [candidate division WWE3 bacterium RIFOXYC1_FULL_39_7]OGC78015.1 MAG: hypothetical protein A2619_02940 [candidate division WWE3 bacterium RIFOXYD1_FULL_39_9]